MKKEWTMRRMDESIYRKSDNTHAPQGVAPKARK